MFCYLIFTSNFKNQIKFGKLKKKKNLKFIFIFKYRKLSLYIIIILYTFILMIWYILYVFWIKKIVSLMLTNTSLYRMVVVQLLFFYYLFFKKIFKLIVVQLLICRLVNLSIFNRSFSIKYLILIFSSCFLKPDHQFCIYQSTSMEKKYIIFLF